MSVGPSNNHHPSLSRFLSSSFIQEQHWDFLFPSPSQSLCHSCFIIINHCMKRGHLITVFWYCSLLPTTITAWLPLPLLPRKRQGLSVKFHCHKHLECCATTLLLLSVECWIPLCQVWSVEYLMLRVRCYFYCHLLLWYNINCCCWWEPIYNGCISQLLQCRF